MATCFRAPHTCATTCNWSETQHPPSATHVRLLPSSQLAHRTPHSQEATRSDFSSGVARIGGCSGAAAPSAREGRGSSPHPVATLSRPQLTFVGHSRCCSTAYSRCHRSLPSRVRTSCLAARPRVMHAIVQGLAKPTMPINLAVRTVAAVTSLVARARKGAGGHWRRRYRQGGWPPRRPPSSEGGTCWKG